MNKFKWIADEPLQIQERKTEQTICSQFYIAAELAEKRFKEISYAPANPNAITRTIHT